MKDLRTQFKKLNLYNAGIESSRLFARARIKGSYYIELGDFDDFQGDRKKSPATIVEQLKKYGLSDAEDTLNILYGTNDNLGPTRLGGILLDVGFQNFRILDGGLLGLTDRRQPHDLEFEQGGENLAAAPSIQELRKIYAPSPDSPGLFLHATEAHELSKTG